MADKAPKNFVHVVFNNGAHDSVGGQPTVGLKVDFTAIARAVGYPNAFSVNCKDDLLEVLRTVGMISGPLFLEVKVKKGNRIGIGRPTSTPIQNKEALMNFLSK